ncbi:MAG: 5' nucleotidase, NT5C type [Candidatus Hodarchaeales archaeon]|jgi:5'(3')-deoxyribonucleotidase
MVHNCKCIPRVVALDVESVLADTHKGWITHYNKQFTLADITDWDFNSLNEKWNETLETFLYETDKLWEKDPHIHIPPVVQDLKIATSHLKPFDIVTSRKTLGGIIRWINFHQIEYRAIVYIPDGKAELNYPIYIDDNPNLASDLKQNQFLWLIDQPYNQDISDSSQIKRVSSISEVILD